MKKLLIYVMLILILVVPVYASSLDEAKEIVDNYYLFSKEKNVESYSNLFDQEYVRELYGEDYKDFFKEVLSYFDVDEYSLDFQYYTEGEDSLTLFFNLEAEVVVDGLKNDLDNDLVALFSKNNGVLKLKYIILQETFIEQMNREVIYEGAIGSFVEENSDLIEEAEKKNIPLVDYTQKFEDMIDKHNNSSLYIILILIVGIILLVVFKEKIKNKEVKKYVDKIDGVTRKTGSLIKKNYEKSKPVIKDKYRRGKNVVKKHTKKIIKKIK